MVYVKESKALTSLFSFDNHCIDFLKRCVYFYYFHMSALPACIRCITCVPGAHMGQKKMSDPLQL